jgi:GR25 family glycosyltransferase involved in LPS biosynthesis
MRLFDRFDKVFCINLDRRNDRLDNFNKEVKKFNLGEYERISAIDGKNLESDTKLDTGNLGLIMTVKNILEKSFTMNYKKILILEDDCYFTDEVMKIDEYFSVLPLDWDMLYMGGNHNLHVGSKPPIKINEKVIKLHNTYTSHFVALKENVFEDIIIQINGKDKPIDVIYSILQKKYLVYSFYPAIAKQSSDFSDINQGYVNYDWLIK